MTNKWGWFHVLWVRKNSPGEGSKLRESKISVDHLHQPFVELLVVIYGDSGVRHNNSAPINTINNKSLKGTTGNNDELHTKLGLLM